MSPFFLEIRFRVFSKLLGMVAAVAGEELEMWKYRRELFVVCFFRGYLIAESSLCRPFAPTSLPRQRLPGEQRDALLTFRRRVQNPTRYLLYGHRTQRTTTTTNNGDDSDGSDDSTSTHNTDD